MSTGYWEMNTRTKIIWIQFKSYQQYNHSQAIEITGPYVKYAEIMTNNALILGAAKREISTNYRTTKMCYTNNIEE